MFGRLETVSPRSALQGRETAIAAVLTAVWVLLLLAYGAGYFGLLGDMATPRDAAFLEVVFFLMVLVLPVALVWLTAAVLQRSFRIQDEARQLEARVRELQSGNRTAGVSQPRIKDNRIEGLQVRIGEMNKEIKQLEASLTALRQSVAALQSQQSTTSGTPISAPTQPPLPLAQPSGGEAAQLDTQTLIKALDFPRDEKDNKGFRALRIAKQNAEAAELLRAAEDMLNLLSQEGIYMDDLRPAESPAREWRLFAEGTRGADVANVGAIIAPEALERISARKAGDQIFRDAALFFLRRFDTMLKEFVEHANDAEIQLLADTRSGRAFMLMARASGMFD